MNINEVEQAQRKAVTPGVTPILGAAATKSFNNAIDEMEEVLADVASRCAVGQARNAPISGIAQAQSNLIALIRSMRELRDNMLTNG